LYQTLAICAGFLPKSNALAIIEQMFQGGFVVDFKKARDFVYANGQLWERALFAYCFQDGSAKHVQECLRCYRNSDGGYGNALEHDIRYPHSHPLPLEFLLRLLHDTGLPAGDLLGGAADWVEANQNDDGSLRNPPDLLDYPHAPWWDEGGQSKPDSIVGGLMREGKANAAIVNKTRAWVKANLSLEAIESEKWLFMLYHAYDYFMNDSDFPNVERYRQATIQRIIALAKTAPENQAHSIFMFVRTPESPVAKAAPALIQRSIDLAESQQIADGSWPDQHNLLQWMSHNTIINLQRLKAFGRS
jgi:hypothetical protein